MQEHYCKEGLCQNTLVKELLAEKVELLEQKADLERTIRIAEEAHLNYQEVYEITAEEASKAVKTQRALEWIIAHMEAHQLPQRLKNVELANALKAKEEANELFEKNLQCLQKDCSTLSLSLSLSLSQAQLETNL